jgi:hypothetical protein
MECESNSAVLGMGFRDLGFPPENPVRRAQWAALSRDRVKARNATFTRQQRAAHADAEHHTRDTHACLCRPFTPKEGFVWPALLGAPFRHTLGLRALLY